MTSSVRKLVLWSLSILLVLGFHLGIFFWSLFWRAETLPVELPPAAMIIELAPVPAVAKPTPPPPPQVVEPEPEPEPKVVEAPKPRLEIAKPKPKPKPRPERPRPLPPKPEQKPAEPVEEVAQTQAPASDSAPTQAQAKAPVQAAASGPSPAEVSWQSRLLSHLARYKRYPDDARRRNQEGVVKLRFSVDGNGRVLSYSVAERSSSPSLDRATQQMLRRAQPLPKPPAELLRNGSVEVVAPFVYSLKHHH